MVLESAGFNATELSAYCRERGLFPEQVDSWRQTAQDANANANAVLTMAEQRDLEKRHQQDQKEIKQLNRICAVRKKPWRRLQHCCSRRLPRSDMPQKKSRPSGERTGRTDDPGRSPEGR